MELKLRYPTTCSAALTRSNRTFMELKPIKMKINHCTKLGSNRTFMELKHPWNSSPRSFERVLIVPLWN